MKGELEPTNSPYAMAKITAIEMGKSMNKQYNHQILQAQDQNSLEINAALVFLDHSLSFQSLHHLSSLKHGSNILQKRSLLFYMPALTL